MGLFMSEFPAYPLSVSTCGLLSAQGRGLRLDVPLGPEDQGVLANLHYLSLITPSPKFSKTRRTL